MKKLIAPALLAMVAMASHALAQSATDTDPGATTGGRSSPAADSSGTGTDRSAAGGQPSTTRRGAAQAGTQRSTTQSSATTSQASRQGNQGDKLSQHIAVCLTLSNQEEAALGEFAQDRAQSPEVKQFAQMMAQEHQQAVQKIQQAVPQVASLNLQVSAQGQPGAANRGAGSAANSTTSAQNSGQQRTSAAGGSAEDQQMVQLAQEIKQECLNLTTAELGQKQGAEFDKCYMGQQLVAHTQMLAHLKAYQKHASSQLKPIIQEGTQMTEHHLAQARQIIEQLSAADNAGGPGGQNQQPGARPTQPRS